MKIQIGEILMNRTYKYLRPVLRTYGKEFQYYVEGMFKVAMGIGDIIVMDSGIRFEKHMFVLVNTKMSRSMFLKALRWLRVHESYEDDYPFDQIVNGYLHMIVLRVPSKFERTLLHFKNSRYSKMYTQEQIIGFFQDNPDTYSILTKDKDYRIEFVKDVNERFVTEITPEEFGEGELDYPIEEAEEFFNYIHKLTEKQFEPDDDTPVSEVEDNEGSGG